LVVKQSSPDNPTHKKPQVHKEKSTKKVSARTRSDSTQTRSAQSAVSEHSRDGPKKKQRRSVQKEQATSSKSKSNEVIQEEGSTQAEVESESTTMKVTRPENEVVTYTEVDFEFREIPADGEKVLIGPARLTRFEKARITGARSLQLSLGAPSFISVSPDIRDSISLAIAEIESKALPISIRRILPNGLYQDIPIDWMKV
jgi:DNA-directed RNA polymerase I, II, and III subunit RPABC2